MKNGKNIEQKLEALRQVRLSSAEKIRVRNALEHLVQEESAPTHHESPIGILVFLSYLARPLPIVAASLIFFVGASTALAAEWALPGDTLYPIKVNVNEEVRAAVTLSSESKAEWELRRAERRLEEAALLAENDELDDEKRNDLDTRVAIHTNRAEEITESADESSDAQDRLAVIEERIAATLYARDRLVRAPKREKRAEAAPTVAMMATLPVGGGVEEASTDDVFPEVEIEDPEDAYRAGIVRELESVSAEKVHPKDVPQLAQEIETESIFGARIQGKEEALQGRIKAAEKLLKKKEDKIDEATREFAREKLAAADEERIRAKELASRDNYEAALEHLDTALELVLDAHVSIANSTTTIPYPFAKNDGEYKDHEEDDSENWRENEDKIGNLIDENKDEDDN